MSLITRVPCRFLATSVFHFNVNSSLFILHNILYELAKVIDRVLYNMKGDESYLHHFSILALSIADMHVSRRRGPDSGTIALHHLDRKEFNSNHPLHKACVLGTYQEEAFSAPRTYLILFVSGSVSPVLKY